MNALDPKHVPESVVTLAAFDEPAKNTTDGGYRYTALLGNFFPQSTLVDERLAHVEDDPPNSPQHMSFHVTRVTATRNHARATSHIAQYPGDDGLVIVAVEGPSAAGKTTWCRRQPWPVVPEYAPTGNEPDGGDEDGRAAYWVRVNCDRWQQALQLEDQHHVVLCDSDPMKLHYSWCLARIGAAPWSRFERELHYVREAVVTEALGFADMVFVSIPPVDVLRDQKASDAGRRRRSFALHARLAEPLREWYSAIERVDPGRVVWSWPTPGVPLIGTERAHRCDPDLLDRVVQQLPAYGHS